MKINAGDFPKSGLGEREANRVCWSALTGMFLR